MTTWHMSGAGNQFVVIRADIDFDIPSFRRFVPALCDRNSIGLAQAEGVLVLVDCNSESFTCLFFNPDGSSGMMCGNGSRCIVRFAFEKCLSVGFEQAIGFTLNNVAYTGWMKNPEYVTVQLPPPTEERKLSLEVSGHSSCEVEIYYVNVNSDHIVVYTNEELSIDTILSLRHNAQFERGVNVNIVSKIDNNTIWIRTFERGVEDFTQACGTGALSAVIALWRTRNTTNNVIVYPPSGRPLTVELIHVDDMLTGLLLSGDAVYDAEPLEFFDAAYQPSN